MNLERILSGLTARGVAWDAQGSAASFNTAHLRRLEHAALLRGLKGPALAWAYWQHLGDDRQIPIILAALTREAAKHCQHYRQARPEGFAKAALAEWLRPACPNCDGRGTLPRGGTCPRCKGAGGKQLSRRALALLIGVSQWQETYAGPLARLLAEMAAWEQAIYQTARRNFQE